MQYLRVSTWGVEKNTVTQWSVFLPPLVTFVF